MPISKLDQCRMVTDKSFKHSLVNNIPMPQATLASNGDAFVPFHDYVLFALAMATPVPKGHRYHQIVSSVAHPIPSAVQAFVVLWMDDWDANSCHSKLNRLSIFSAVAIILLADARGALLGAFSNLIAVGKKGNSHKQFLLDCMSGPEKPWEQSA